MVASPVSFQITDIVCDETGTLLTLSSVPGASYTIQYSTDLVDWSDEVIDGLDSQGDTTTSQDTSPARLNEPVRFYRVIQ